MINEQIDGMFRRATDVNIGLKRQIMCAHDRPRRRRLYVAFIHCVASPSFHYMMTATHLYRNAWLDVMRDNMPPHSLSQAYYEKSAQRRRKHCALAVCS